MIELVLIILVVLVIGAFFVLSHFSRKRREQKVRELSALITDLERNPEDTEVSDKVAKFPAFSMRGLSPEVVRDLWNQALRFAVPHLHLSSGQAVAYRVAVPLASVPTVDSAQFVAAAANALPNCMDNRGIPEVIMTCLRGMPIATNQRQWFYERVLEQVQRSPDSSNSAILALEVGRWHLGATRPDGKVTVYDEQAIQNDIVVRRGKP